MSANSQHTCGQAVFSTGWICPKCARVWAPAHKECEDCNAPAKTCPVKDCQRCHHDGVSFGLPAYSYLLEELEKRGSNLKLPDLEGRRSGDASIVP